MNFNELPMLKKSLSGEEYLSLRCVGCPLSCCGCRHGDVVVCSNKLIPEQDVIDYIVGHSSSIVSIGGGEPTVQPGVSEFLDRLKGAGKRIMISTSGMSRKAIVDIDDLVNHYYLDYKTVLPKYQYTTGIRKVIGIDVMENLINIDRSKLTAIIRANRRLHKDSDIIGMVEELKYFKVDRCVAIPHLGNSIDPSVTADKAYKKGELEFMLSKFPFVEVASRSEYEA